MPKPQAPSKLTVDFSNVGDRTEGGRSIHVPEGDYLAQVVACQRRAKKDDENSFYLSWQLAPIKPEKYKGKGVIYHTTSLKEESLWSLRNFLEDLGIPVPKSKVGIPIQQIVAKKMIIGITVEDDEYNGKLKSKVAATFKKADYEEHVDEDEEEEEEEEEETPKPTTKKTKKPEPEEEEEEEDEDLDELDVDDL